jgi:rhamnose utilization protein RhaD (predicted bifunctional aldolase and dehydrogenase)
MTQITADPEFHSLLRYSAAIGADPALVQAAGGNVSLKRDGVLWVKASGTWLAHALDRQIMVPVDLPALLRAVHRGDAAAVENTAAFVVADQDATGLRPSIETTLHAMLPHPVVVHVHCVETIAWAARRDAATAVAPLLAGLRWTFVPYVRPGAPLTFAMLQVLQPDTDVLVLGSHGLVVGGATTEAAAALLADVSRRLRRPARTAPSGDMVALARAAAGTGYRPADDPATHGTATDPAAFAVARLGSLYPDHVIFLGPGITTDVGGNRIMAVVPGAGVLLRDDATPGAIALARCLADVTARLDPAEPIVTLSADQDAELLGWDAEKYRQQLNRA